MYLSVQRRTSVNASMRDNVGKVALLTKDKELIPISQIKRKLYYTTLQKLKTSNIRARYM